MQQDIIAVTKSLCSRINKGNFLTMISLYRLKVWNEGDLVSVPLDTFYHFTLMPADPKTEQPVIAVSNMMKISLEIDRGNFINRQNDSHERKHWIAIVSYIKIDLPFLLGVSAHLLKSLCIFHLSFLFPALVKSILSHFFFQKRAIIKPIL